MQQHTHETKTRTHSTNQHTHARTRPTHARDPEIPAAPSSLATNPSSPSRSRDPAAISLSTLASSCSTAAPPAAHLCACTSLSPSSRSAPLPWHRRLALDLRPPSLASPPAADAGASSSFRRRQERLVLDHTTSCRRPRPRPLVVPRISALNHRPSLALSVSTRRRELLRSVDRPSFVSGSSSSPRNPFCPVSASAPASANLSHVPDVTRELLRHRQRPSPRRAALDHRHRLPEGLQDPPQALHRPLRPRFRRPVPRCRRTLVYKGRVPGVYEKWVNCHQQVDKLSGNSYRGYATREEAVTKWRRHVWKMNQTKILMSLLLTGIAVTVYYIMF